MTPGRVKKPTVICRYLSFRDPDLGEYFKLPMVHVRLRHGERSFRTNALVDSGATCSLIPRELLMILDFDENFKERTDAKGAGGTFKAYRIGIDSMEILKGMTKVCEFRNMKLLTSEPDAIPYLILGRDYIFQEYDICFRETQQKLVLKPPRRDH